MWAIDEMILLVILVVCACVDWRYKRIPVFLLVLAGGLVILFHYFHKGFWLHYALGSIPGVVFLFLSKITREGIGYADSAMILILGAYFGWRDILALLFLAFLFSGLASIFLMVFKKVNKKFEFPFFPFLLLGYVLVIISRGKVI